MIFVYIISLLAAIWYINTYVLAGDDKQLIMVRAMILILCLYTFAILLLKAISPKDINQDNVAQVFGIIKDLTFLMAGYLFAKNTQK